ncbi:hypothetical protein [Methanosarcina horonobensis]|nr:hypothetical protein [Methanosarcina horonobensis]
MRREVQELRKAIIPPNRSSENLLPTPEFLRCSKELEMAQARSRQRLIDNGISESELLERERRGLICDAEVMKVRHNLLRAAWNAKNLDDPQIKINYLFDCPVEVENYKKAFDKMNALLNKDRTPEVVNAEKELFQIMQDAGR